MKYCTYCGKELLDEAVICVGCGCPVNVGIRQQEEKHTAGSVNMINTLSQRLNINGIIWLVIGVLQIIGGIFINWIMIVVGVLNIISAVNDMNYSKRLKISPSGIVAKFEPIVGPVITLIYNLVIGGVIGVAGSVYYFIAIRNFVMENKAFFADLDAQNEMSE